MLLRSLQNQTEFIAGDGSIIRELLNPVSDSDLSGVGYSLAHATVPAGNITLKHVLNVSEIYYVVSGKGQMHIGEESRSIKAGDAVYIPPGCEQWIENTGESDLEFLCIVEPAWTAECETVSESDSDG